MLLSEVKGRATDFLKQRSTYTRFESDGSNHSTDFEWVGDTTGDTYKIDGTTVSKDKWDQEQKAYTDLKWTPIVSTDENNDSKVMVQVNSMKSVEDSLAKLDQLME